MAVGTHGVAVLGGFCERDSNTLFNSAAAIDSGGRIVGVYRKLHLFDRERDVLTPGDGGLPLVTVARLRVGILVSYDPALPGSDADFGAARRRSRRRSGRVGRHLQHPDPRR
jgi:predicted amidohydrolase